jgi:electron transport complex protein RnfB
MKRDLLIVEIDAILPQTQCRQCGFDGCEPYATAIAEGRAQINQCPPGGEQGVRHLAQLLRVNPLPLNTAHGVTKPKAIAFIEESVCIGCTLCIAACPVDAIVGAAKLAHTVISAECTGCELCIAPCPVNCISMVPLNAISYSGDTHSPDAAPQQSPTATLSFSSQHDERMKASERARVRYRSRLRRLAREKMEREEKLATTRGTPKPGNTPSPDPVSAIAGIGRAAIEAALVRAKAYRPPAGEKNQS